MSDVAQAIGINETKELLVGVNELSIELVKHFRDGIQLSDVMAIIDSFKNNPDLLTKLMAAKDNIQAVPAEIKDITFAEGVELGILQFQYAPKIIAALKPQA